MKVLIAVSYLLAVASAGLIGHSAYTYPYLADHSVAYATEHSKYYGPQHIPVIGKNGVPVDEPAVQHARAEHAAHHLEATLRNGDAHHTAPVVYTAEHSIYHGPQHIPVIGANGVPVDEPAVQHARAEHAAHYIEAKVRNGDVADVHHVIPFEHYRKRRSVFGYAAPLAYTHYIGPQHIPIIGANGVPVDEPAIQHARAEHAVYHHEAAVRNGDVYHVHQISPVVYAAEHSVYHGIQHIPVIGANGVPVDEPAVQHARAEHAAHHHEAKVRNGDVAHYYRKRRSVFNYNAPVIYSHYAGPQHYPIIGANSVPVDEPAVQHARAAHAAHHLEATIRNGDARHHIAPLAYNANHVVAHTTGAIVPVDTIEVAAAKAAHYAAHVEANARNSDLHHHFVTPVVHAY